MKKLIICTLICMILFSLLSTISFADVTLTEDENCTDVGEYGYCLLVQGWETASTIDCQGYSIYGSGQGYGIYVSDSCCQEYPIQNTTIKNCNIYNFSKGIWFRKTGNDLVQNTTIRDCGTGIVEDGGLYSWSYSSPPDIALNRIEDSTFYNNGVGIDIYNGYFTLDNVAVYNNTVDGVNLRQPEACDYPYITKNSKIYNNTEVGLTLNCGCDNQVNDTILENNSLGDYDTDYLGYCDPCQYIVFDNVTLTTNKPIVYITSPTNINNWNNNFSQMFICDANNTNITNLSYTQENYLGEVFWIENSSFLNMTNSNIDTYFGLGSETETMYFVGDFTNVTIKNTTFNSTYDSIYAVTNSFLYWLFDKLSIHTGQSGGTTQGYGMQLTFASNGTLSNSNISKSEYGIMCEHCTYNIFTNNTFTGSGEVGISFNFESHYNSLTRNEFNATATALAFSNNCTGNSLYNNLFNSSIQNINFNTWEANDWNTTRQSGTPIFGTGDELGGNWWTLTTCTGVATNCTEFQEKNCVNWEDYGYIDNEDCCSGVGCSWDAENATCTGTGSGANCDSDFGNGYFDLINGCGGGIGLDLAECSWNSSGFSNTCTNVNGDEFCDDIYDVENDYTCTIGVDCPSNIDMLAYAAGAVNDTTPPTYSLNSANSTNAGEPVGFSLRWADNIEVSGYIFSFDNCTGTLVNDTWVESSEPSIWSNVTKVVNYTHDCTIRWCEYANDSSDNWASTCESPYEFQTVRVCPTTITNYSIPCEILSSNETYTISENLSASLGVYPFIKFREEAVVTGTTLNCNGYTLSGSSYGIIVYGDSNVVKNCVVSDFTEDAILLRGDDTQVYNITEINNFYGVKVDEGSTNNEIYNITGTGNDFVVWALNTNTIHDIVGSNGNNVVFLVSASNSAVYNITSINNSYGIYLDDSTYANVYNCTLSNNTYGIYISGTYTWVNSITQNTIYNNTYGIHIQGTVACADYVYPPSIGAWVSSTTITNNSIHDNTYGIDDTSSYGDTISSNTFYNNQIGLRVYKTVASSMSNNNFYDNQNAISLVNSGYLKGDFLCNIPFICGSEPFYIKTCFIVSPNTLLNNNITSNVNGVNISGQTYDTIDINNLTSATYDVVLTNVNNYEIIDKTKDTMIPLGPCYYYGILLIPECYEWYHMSKDIVTFVNFTQSSEKILFNDNASYFTYCEDEICLYANTSNSTLLTRTTPVYSNIIETKWNDVLSSSVTYRLTNILNTTYYVYDNNVLIQSTDANASNGSLQFSVSSGTHNLYVNLIALSPSGGATSCSGGSSSTSCPTTTITQTPVTALFGAKFPGKFDVNPAQITIYVKPGESKKILGLGMDYTFSVKNTGDKIEKIKVNPQGLQGVWVSVDSVFAAVWIKSDTLVLQPGGTGYVRLTINAPKSSLAGVDYTIPVQFYDENSGGEQTVDIIAKVYIESSDLLFYFVNKILYPEIKFTPEVTQQQLNVFGVAGWDGNYLIFKSDFYAEIPILLKALLSGLVFYIIWRITPRWKKTMREKVFIELLNILIPLAVILIW